MPDIRTLMQDTGLPKLTFTFVTLTFTPLNLTFTFLTLAFTLPNLTFTFPMLTSALSNLTFHGIKDRRRCA